MPIDNTSNQIANQYGAVKEIEDMVSGAPIARPQQAPVNVAQPQQEQEFMLPNGEPTIVPGSIPDARPPLTPDEYNEVSGLAPWLMLLQSNPTPEIEDLGRELLEIKRSEYGYQIPRPGGVADNGQLTAGQNQTTGENRVSGTDQQATVPQPAQLSAQTGSPTAANPSTTAV